MKEYSYIVDTYAFETPTMIEEAKKEEEAIAYIREHTDIANVKNAVSLYRKFNEKPSFHTEIGLGFMRELFEIIAASGTIERKNIPPIKVESYNPFRIEPAMDPEEEGKRNTKAEQALQQVKVRHRNLWIVNAFLIIIIVGMFYVTMTADYSYISDYETKLLDKYASWEEDLTEREKLVQEKEQSLNEQSLKEQSQNE